MAVGLAAMGVIIPRRAEGQGEIRGWVFFSAEGATGRQPGVKSGDSWTELQEFNAPPK
jgi:hypothetical protein